jgi:hypothetical protein
MQDGSESGSTMGCTIDIEPVISEVRAHAIRAQKLIEDEAHLEYLQRGNALFLMAPTSRVRIFVHKIVSTPVFQHGTLLVIILSAVIAATEPAPQSTPSDDDVDAEPWRRTADNVFLGIFFVEMCLKIVDEGLLLHKSSYLRSGWNILDFIIIVSGVIDVIEASVAVSRHIRRRSHAISQSAEHVHTVPPSLCTR